MHALEKSRSLEEIAHREVSGTRNPFHRAEALDRWMRKTIRQDLEKYNSFLSRRHSPSYRNSVQTCNDTQGICGEQAFLYIVLCRYAGLDARFLIKHDMSHAMTRVTTPGGPLDVDHMDPYGFDRPAGNQFREVQDQELEQLFQAWNGGQLPVHNYQETTQSQEQLQYPIQDRMPHLDSFSLPDFGNLLSSLRLLLPTSFTKGCAVTLMAWTINSHWDHLLNRPHPRSTSHSVSTVIPNQYAQPYIHQVRETLEARYGTKAPRIIEELTSDFDGNKDHILDRFEAYQIYISILPEDQLK